MRASRGPVEHGSNCDCTRCTGFEPGNALSTSHGAYAVVALGPRVEELAADLAALVPAYSAADAIAVRLLGLALARLERAEAALDTAAPADMGRLRSDALGWANAARRLLGDLGMTPTSRAKLGVNVARVHEHALARLADEGQQVADAREAS